MKNKNVCLMNVRRVDEVNTIENIGLMFWVCQMTALQVRVCVSLASLFLDYLRCTTQFPWVT